MWYESSGHCVGITLTVVKVIIYKKIKNKNKNTLKKNIYFSTSYHK